MTTNPKQEQVLAHGHHAASGPVVEPFITKPEVARRLNKKVRTVDNWMQH